MPNDAFKDNLMVQMGLQQLPDDKKAALLDSMSELVEQRVLLRLMNQLSDEDGKAFEALPKDDTETKIAFLQEHVPDVAAIMDEEIMAVRSDLVESVTNDEELNAIENLT